LGRRADDRADGGEEECEVHVSTVHWKAVGDKEKAERMGLSLGLVQAWARARICSTTSDFASA
jgi:hypothetical protein